MIKEQPMESKIKERCIYCGGDVYYHSGKSLIKCDWCGQTIPVMKFQGEMTRMKKTEEENALIKKQLEEAEKEKQAANDRLFVALSDFGRIRDDQDTLGKVVQLLTEGQGDALQSLEFLKGVSERLVSTQNDIFGRMGVMQEIGIQLKKNGMAEQEFQTVMNEFMMWSQQIRGEDMQRLQEIASSADELIESQQELKAKMDELKAAADLHQQTLQAFRGQYTRDKMEKIQKLYCQAADYQYDRRYDKAEEYYRRMLTEGDEDAEVYWRLIMCHYCMFYEKDDNGRMIPIILNPDLTDPAEMSLRKELAKHMTEEEKTYYETRLRAIDQILDKYRLLKSEVQYDVFISVKQDDGGHYTSDSDVASDLYDFMTSHGLRVFNSRRAVIPVGQEYEPYIISALISSKVLIVVGSTPENMNSKWVKNEWSRFQWLQFREKEKTGKTDRVLFCYLTKGMQAEQIPRALHPDRQAIHDGVKAHDELLTAIAFLKKTGNQTEESVYMPALLPEQDYGKIKNQMTLWLIRGKYDKVLEKYEQLNEEGLFLTYPSLHMTALCANSRVADIMQIINSAFVLEDAPEYKAAVLLCDDEKEKQTLEGYLVQNREWRNKQRRKSITSNNKDIRFFEQENEASKSYHENEVNETTEVQSDHNKKEIEKEQEAAPGHETEKKQQRLEESEANTITFGRYVQKENGSPEPIEWLVLERENGRMLIVSKYALDCQPYNKSFKGVTWETCSLRKWLNESFVNNAFNTYEQKMIVSSVVTADKNPTYFSLTTSGKNTVDKVFLLSITEVNKYFTSDKARECQGTKYCDAKEAHRIDDNCWWWLRSPGCFSNRAAYVLDDGSVNTIGSRVINSNCFPAVRPALWIDLESETKKKEEETEKTKAEAEGQTISQENPEEWYKRGKEAYGKKNYTEAVMWWRKAADQDDVNAQIALGDFYDEQYNRKEAVYWYQKAADQGDPSAQWHLETPLPEPDLDPEGPDNDNSSSEESEDLAAMFDELFGSPCE